MTTGGASRWRGILLCPKPEQSLTQKQPQALKPKELGFLDFAVQRTALVQAGTNTKQNTLEQQSPEHQTDGSMDLCSPRSYSIGPRPLRLISAARPWGVFAGARQRMAGVQGIFAYNALAELQSAISIEEWPHRPWLSMHRNIAAGRRSLLESPQSTRKLQTPLP